MKKICIYLGMAALTFANAAVASNLKPATQANAYAGTPLCMAISKGDVATVKKFVEYGVDVNERSNDMTPLMMAARYNNVEIMEFLLSKGAKIDARTEGGLTALQYATLSNAKEAQAFLRDKGAKK